MEIRMEESWKKVLSKEFEQPYFANLVDFVKEQYRIHPNSIFPKGNQIFRAFDACPFNKVKVVVLGQDPYPTRGHAHGLCFSCDASVQPLPRSLNNIFKELKDDLDIEPALNGDLNRWAEQGVLLLNSVLTVEEGKADSHKGKGWELFTDAVINALNDNKHGIVYLLWGSKAIKKAENVDRSKNLVLTAPHPSPLSAHRGFFGSKPFSKINAYLEQNNMEPIKW